MCEHAQCNNRIRFRVQRNSANKLVCGRHVTATVVALAGMSPETAHPLYHIHAGTSVTVKLRTETSPGVVTYV